VGERQAEAQGGARGEDGRTWLVGEDTWTPGTSGDALRYMNDPADDGVSRDYWTSGIGSVDVHYGSGVPNLAFYLLSEGGLHPRGKSTVNVTAIGADDAAAIWYLALTSYMTISTNFAGARTAQINAATALFGATSQQVQSVTNSWAAVGVGAAWGTPAPTCTTRTYSGSISRAGRSVYAPSSSGVTAGTTPMSLALTGPSSANFNLALERKSGSRWSAVASSTGSTSTEAISYTGTSGTYRATVNSVTGTGSFSLTWCY
jgi:vibriolysin